MFKTISVALRLNYAQFSTGLGVAAGQAKEFGRELSGAGNTGEASLKKVGTAGMLVGGAMVAGLGLAVHAAMGFEQQLSNLQAVSGATGDEMQSLRQQALDAGAATVFSASEAAQAQTELAKAGVQTGDILSGGLNGALNLASAGNLDLATAATFAANAMTTFKLSGSDVPRIADALAAGANKSAADVDDMGQALQQAGLVADQTGLSMEQTVGVLSMFAQAGLRGSDAGTSLKTALLRLNPTTKEASELMAELGLDFYDAQGNFIGIDNAAGQLASRLGGLTQEQRNAALATIFGQDAIRAGTILYESGAEGVRKWTDEVSESGYAAELARQKNDNLAGDLEQLRGSLETNLIQGGSMATDALRGLAQAGTTVVNGFAAMPGPLQVAGIGLTGIVGLATLAAGAVATLAPKIAALKEALDGMGSVGQFVSRNFTNIAIGAGIAGIALTALSYWWGQNAADAAKAAAMADEYTRALLDNAGASDAAVNKVTAQHIATGKIADMIGTLEVKWETFGWAVRNNQRELDDWKSTALSFNGLDKLVSKLQEAADAGNPFAQELMRLRNEYKLTDNQIKDIILTLDTEAGIFAKGSAEAERQGNVLDGMGASQDDAAASTEGLTGAQTDLAAEAEKVKEAINDAKQAIDDYLGVTFGADAALDRFQGDLNDIAEAVTKVKTEGQGAFDGPSNAAIAFRETMRGVVSDAGDVVQAWIDQGIQGDELTTRMYLLGASFLDQAEKAGVPREVAQQYLDKLLAIPANVNTNIQVTGADVARTIFGNLRAQLGDLEGAHYVDVKVRQTIENIVPFGMGNPRPNANGNVYPPGVAAFASGGEWHQAQILGPGAGARLWNEPEAGGEAYIPLAASKRGRSLALWWQTGRHLGLDVDSLQRMTQMQTLGRQQYVAASPAMAMAGAPVGDLGGAGTPSVVHQDNRRITIAPSGLVGDRRGLARELSKMLADLEHS